MGPFSGDGRAPNGAAPDSNAFTHKREKTDRNRQSFARPASSVDRRRVLTDDIVEELLDQRTNRPRWMRARPEGCQYKDSIDEYDDLFGSY